MAAYESRPHFAVLYNIGQAYLALGRLAEAVGALEHYLREAEGQVPMSQLQQVDAQVKAKRSQIAAIVIRTDVRGARVLVDEREVGQTPIAEPLFVMPGTHSLRVLAQDKQELTRSLTLAPGESLDLELTLRDIAVPAPPRVETSSVCQGPECGTLLHNPLASGSQPAAVDVSSTRFTAVLGYVIGGAGLALGAGAIGHFWWNRGRYQDWKDARSKLLDARRATDYLERQEAHNDLAFSIERASRVTIGLTLASAALTAAGVTLVVLDNGGAHLRPELETSAGMKLSLGGRF